MTQTLVRSETAEVSAMLQHLSEGDRRWLEGIITGLDMARKNAPPVNMEIQHEVKRYQAG